MCCRQAVNWTLISNINYWQSSNVMAHLLGFVGTKTYYGDPAFKTNSRTLISLMTGFLALFTEFSRCLLVAAYRHDCRGWCPLTLFNHSLRPITTQMACRSQISPALIIITHCQVWLILGQFRRLHNQQQQSEHFTLISVLHLGLHVKVHAGL